MKFFIRTFIFLLVLLAAGYGYSWYKNKQAVDQLFEQSPDASYKSTYIDINGDSVITDVKFKSPLNDSSISIAEVRAGTGSFISSFKVSSALDVQDYSKLPDYFDFYFNLSDISFPIEGQDNDDNSENGFLNQLQFAGCGEKQSLSVNDIRSFGINQLAGDLNLKFSFNKPASKINSDIYLNLIDFNTSKISFIINNFSFDNPFKAGLGSSQIEISDSGIQRNVNKMCAEQQNLSAKQYTERHISYFKHLLFEKGIYLSPEFYQLYSQYHADPRSIKVSSVPDSPINPMSLFGMSERRAMSELNLDLSFNDNNVPQLYGNRPDPSELPELNKVTEEKSTRKFIQGLTMQPTSVSSLGRYVSYDITFNYRGKKYQGIVKSVDSNTAVINYKVSMGNYITKPFNLSELKQVKIRREYTPPQPIEGDSKN